MSAATAAARLAWLRRQQLFWLWAFAAVTVLSIAAQNVVFLGMGAWAAGLWLTRRWPRRLEGGWLFAIFLALALWASWAGDNRAHSLMTWRKWLLVLVAVYAGDALTEERSLRAVLGSLLFFSGLVAVGGSLWAIWHPVQALLQGQPWAQVSHIWLNDIIWRAGAGSGGYQVLATNSAVLLVFFASLAVYDAAFRRPLALLAMAGLAFGLLFTLTRGAWLAAGLGLGLLGLMFRPRWILIAALLGAGVYLALPDLLFVQRLRSVGDLQNDSNRERLYMTEAGLNIMRQHPGLGVGDSMESFEQSQPDGSVKMQQGWFLRAQSDEARAWYASKGVAGKEQGHLHSVPVQIGAMYGLPALAFFVAFWLSVAWAQVRRWREAGRSGLQRGVALGLALGLAVWAFNGLFEFNFGSFQSSFTLWFLVGLGSAAAALPKGGVEA